MTIMTINYGKVIGMNCQVNWIMNAIQVRIVCLGLAQRMSKVVMYRIDVLITQIIQISIVIAGSMITCRIGRFARYIICPIGQDLLLLVLKE